MAEQSNVKKKDYLKAVGAAGTPETISQVAGTPIMARSFIIQNQDPAETLMVGNMMVPAGSERVYSGLEIGGTDTLWDSEEILVSSATAGHAYAVEYFEVVV